MLDITFLFTLLSFLSCFIGAEAVPLNALEARKTKSGSSSGITKKKKKLPIGLIVGVIIAVIIIAIILAILFVLMKKRKAKKAQQQSIMSNTQQPITQNPHQGY
ncbi:hypothetical protein EJ08DRAFT_438004 [Tothia fuscella]|uniref:Mid2 domain-containing protein n=1 Tax=Tothia fuscella TaxID=1048955 RepID=A0A9P4P0C1_9PEZI|nr:hypothetical protein EJ08DRAFT_438004 [Tothia fuscella]